MYQDMRNKLVSFSFIAPALLLFGIFVMAPFIQGIPIGFFSWNGFSKNRTFIGLQNFKFILEDRYILQSLFKTLQFTLVYILSANVIGLGLALLIRINNKLNQVFRTVFFMPFVISLVLSAFMWSYLYSDVLYPFFGIKSPLGNIHWVTTGLAIIAIWRDSGYCMIIYIAALQSVPLEFYEASEMEGAGKIKQFLTITIPMIVPAFTANVTLLLAWGLKVFDYPMAVTNGGPGRASETLALYVYNNIFHYYKAGYGQAVAVIFTCIIFILSMLVTRSIRSREISL